MNNTAEQLNPIPPRRAPLRLRVWGPLACFAPPHAKVEAVTHPAPTPSAARRLLHSIFGKLEFEYGISAIHVEAPIRRFRDVRKFMQRHGAVIDPETVRTLRSTVWLQDVQYVIEFDVYVNPYRSPEGIRRHGRERSLPEGGARVDAYTSYRGETCTRIRGGGYDTTPYFGRKAAPVAGWRLLEPLDYVAPINQSEDLGTMLLEMVPESKGSALHPAFFDARLDRGTLYTPLKRWEAEVLPALWEARKTDGRNWR